jgi:hypothetical protein
VKLDVRDERVGLAIANELLLEPKPYRAGHKSRCGSDLDEVRGDYAVEPRTDGAVHLTPMRIGRDVGGDVGEDMIRELVHAEHVEEEGLPSVVVRRKIIEEDGDHRLDIEDRDNMSMKSDDCGVGLSSDICPENIIIVRRRWWRKDGRFLWR